MQHFARKHKVSWERNTLAREQALQANVKFREQMQNFMTERQVSQGNIIL